MTSGGHRASPRDDEMAYRSCGDGCPSLGGNDLQRVHGKTEPEIKLILVPKNIILKSMQFFIIYIAH